MATKDFRTVRLLIRLGRLYFLFPGVLLYTLGALVAIENGVAFGSGMFLFGYAIFLFGRVSVHFSNDCFDKDADRAAKRTPISGGSGVLVDHPELANLALMIAVLLLSASMVTAIAFTVFYSFSLWFLLFAVLGGLLGWFYTAPQLRLVYRGLGEASTDLAKGFIMPGMGYLVMSARIDLWFVILSPPGEIEFCRHDELHVVLHRRFRNDNMGLKAMKGDSQSLAFLYQVSYQP